MSVTGHGGRDGAYPVDPTTVTLLRALSPAQVTALKILGAADSAAERALDAEIASAVGRDAERLAEAAGARWCRSGPNNVADTHVVSGRAVWPLVRVGWAQRSPRDRTGERRVRLTDVGRAALAALDDVAPGGGWNDRKGTPRIPDSAPRDHSAPWTGDRRRRAGTSTSSVRAAAERDAAAADRPAGRRRRRPAGAGDA